MNDKYLPQDFPELVQHVQSVPVDLAVICRELGIAVYPEVLGGGISGKLIPKSKLPTGYEAGSSGWSIFVNQTESYGRRRFTIAHELGHFMIHRTAAEAAGGVCDDVFHRSGLQDYMETEANRFAANLLMPWPHVQAYLNERVGQSLNVKEMASHFGVSEVAMAIRLGLDA